MPDATSDFVIFLSMYLSNRYYHNRILHNIISEENAISLYISSKKSVLEGYTDRSLLIRENTLHIFIDDIRMGTHSGTLGEERNDIIFDSRTQSYLYEVTNNIPIEFNKDELLQYLHDRRKIVNIVVYISVQKEEGKIGNLLVTEN